MISGIFKLCGHCRGITFQVLGQRHGLRLGRKSDLVTSLRILTNRETIAANHYKYSIIYINKKLYIINAAILSHIK